ncbi:MAG: helix-turn-helix transcriptional regulator [Bacilli bacterium]
MVYDDLALRIRSIRVQRGINQENVAKHLGISRQAYIRLEAGNRELSFKEATLLSELFDVQLGAIAGEQTVQKNYDLVTLARNSSSDPEALDPVLFVQDVLEHFAAQERLYFRLTEGDQV